MSQDSDLSEYEKIRLENIRKNNEFLAQLGLVPVKPKLVKVETPKIAAKVPKKVKREDDDIITNEKRRRSDRLSGQFVKYEELDTLNEDEDTKSAADPIEAPSVLDFYERVPQESHQLDDFEFQVFVELRRWRLLRSWELAIAPYGLFQNRTFCDMIRRRRNDFTWAAHEGSLVPPMELGRVGEQLPTSPSKGVKAEPTSSTKLSPRKKAGVKDELKQDLSTLTVKTEPVTGSTNTDVSTPQTKLEVVYDPTVIDALTECFGIAGGKTREGGYAWEALAVLNSAKVHLLLEESRTIQPGLVEVEK